MSRFAMVGAAGRMGQAIITLAGSSGLTLTGALESDRSSLLGEKASSQTDVRITSDLDEALRDADVVIDFSNPQTTMEVLEFCVRHRKGLLIGTTGFSEEQKRIIHKSGEAIAVMLSPNMSVGVNLLFHLAAEVASILNEGYDVEIVEAHHNQKVDAPSGTAVRLKEVILDALNRDESNVVYGRNGIVGKRKPEEIGVHSIRGGDTVGDHTVFFMADGERIELTHRASSRNTFARGALRAAAFLAAAPAGFYSMNDLLGFKR